ncbi:MAG: tRNA (adenosine(37)-N6)-threonylcarbamoyltransferase complex ATPase subunit type 1 TsaE [Chitinophagales bacterium]|nr:tRNA (adenosine(37)-N6)-threonylcarbamoyltransferase complex ATPase subunit type 1 TsaE [Chitinophagales bacterium]MCZ2393114.1 tRNA (adenosine(37)-N6)-threonylcarbamoyltransferase complex ATPase subunit type 1 TsaE [Chitinophagales bacterium]
MSKKVYQYNLKELSSVASDILSSLKDERIWTFTGDLGSGKTTFIKEIVALLGSKDLVSSPTYTIANQYIYPQGKVYHIDAYRIDNDEEAFNAGIEEMIYSGDYVFIEWPEKIIDLIPQEAVKIVITSHDNNRILELHTY